MLKAGTDAVFRRDAAWECDRRNHDQHILREGSADVGRIDVNESSRTQEVHHAVERHASLGAAGRYSGGTRALSSSVQGRTTGPSFIAFRELLSARGHTLLQLF